MPAKKYAQFTCKHSKSSNRAELTRVANPKIKVEFASGFPKETTDAVRSFFFNKDKKTTASSALEWQSVDWPVRVGGRGLDSGLRVSAQCGGTWQVVVDFKNNTQPQQARTQLYKKLSQNHIQLLPQQQVYAEEFKDYDWHEGERRASLLFATMGSGKTRGVLAAVSAARPTSRRSNRSRVLIVCSNTLIGNWIETIESSPQGSGETKFVIMGYSEFRNTFHDSVENGFGDISQYVVIIDEAHYYRNLTSAMLQDVALLRRSLFTFMLTGTPLQNEPDEICAVLALLECCSEETGMDEFECNPQTLHAQRATIERVMKKRKNVFYYDPATYDASRFAEHYPKTIETIQNVSMSAPQALEYAMNLSSETKIGPYTIQTARRNSYHALTRAISNVIDPEKPEESPKIRRVVQNILSGEYRGPHVVFSHYLDRGVYAVCKYLRAQAKKANKKLKIVTVSGSVDGRERDNIVNEYNEGKTDVLFITDAAREGVDLHGTGTMHVLECAQNLHGEGQTMGRVARFGSHSHLPDKEQTVTFIKYHSSFPSVSSMEKQRKDLEDYFEKTYKLKAKGKFDIVLALDRLFKQSAGGKTVDQQFSENNIAKAKLLIPWLDLLKRVGDRRKEVAAMAAKQPSVKTVGKKRKKEPKLTANQLDTALETFVIESSPKSQHKAKKQKTQ